jgi:hypothetical protein
VLASSFGAWVTLISEEIGLNANNRFNLFMLFLVWP